MQHLVLKALRHGSHNVTCKQHHELTELPQTPQLDISGDPQEGKGGDEVERGMCMGMTGCGGWFGQGRDRKGLCNSKTVLLKITKIVHVALKAKATAKP